jgi:mannose-6-phosphate isomerase
MYPLILRPMLLEKVWGGDRLGRFGKPVKPGAKIGESWELADLASTSAGGAGGGAFQSVVRNGPFAGKNLRQLIASQGKAIIGSTRLSESGGYPLLVKFLDASEHLSIQVHPSPAYAAAHPGALIKSECWYILAREPGAVIYDGLKPGVTREAFKAAIDSGRVVDCMNAVEVEPGQCFNLPSGTCHALGAGVVCLEVQTASDTTYRVYDWGRTGRALHIEEAMACIDFESPAPAPVRPADASPGTPFLSTPDFSLEFVSVGPAGIPLSDRHGPLIVVGGKGSLVDWLKGYRPEPIGIGTTMFIPAQVPLTAKLVGEASSPLQCVCVKSR